MLNGRANVEKQNILSNLFRNVFKLIELYLNFSNCIRTFRTLFELSELCSNFSNCTRTFEPDSNFPIYELLSTRHTCYTLLGIGLTRYLH